MIKLYVQTTCIDPYIIELNQRCKLFEFTNDVHDNYDYVYGSDIMTEEKIIKIYWEQLPSLSKEELWNAIDMFCSEDKSLRTFGLNLIIYSNCQNYKFLYEFLFNRYNYYNNVSSLMWDLAGYLAHINYNWTEIERSYFKYLWNKCDFKTLK